MLKKILVIKLRHIGDVLLTTPVFRALKENFPDSCVAALVNKGTEAVLDRNPHIDEIITFESTIKKLKGLRRYLEETKFLKNIRNKTFDTTIDLTGGDRAAIISYLSGAKERIGIKSKGFIGKTLLYSETFDIDRSKHAVIQNLEVLERIGLKINKPKIDLHVSEEEKREARSLILNSESKTQNLEKSNSSNKKIVHIHPVSRWLFKCWRDEYMAAVINWFMDNDFSVILTSDSIDREISKINSILSLLPSELSNISKKSSPHLINLAGKLTLRQLIAVSSISDIFFGIDTAPMHIAAALGKPTIALFGPSGAFNWGPWDNETEQRHYSKINGIQRFGKNIVIQRDWDCIPCGKDGCKGSKISNCLFDITPDEVIDILKEEIKKILK